MKQDIIEKFNRIKYKRETLQQELEKRNKSYKENKRNFFHSEKAQIIIQEVAKETQQNIKQYIEDIVGMALQSVFPEPYNFRVEFVIKRNKTEAELYFEKNNELMKPLESSGYGAVDIASFALRIALLTLKLGKKRKIIILDEPFKFLSRDLQHKAGEMLKKLSNDIGIQFIIVTHNQDIIESAEKIFELKRIGSETLCTILNKEN